jgi:hypothetical protein
VTGLDVSPGLLAAARDRVPDAELWLGPAACLGCAARST